MWYKSESTARPDLIDSTSSRVHVYVRKNIEEVEREDETGNKYSVYVYDEMKLPKEVYGIFKEQMVADSRLADIEEVITEIIGGDYNE
jgi:hypothetical protein